MAATAPGTGASSSEAASLVPRGARYGWPLHVVEDAADDPPRDRPDAFLGALRAALEAG